MEQYIFDKSNGFLYERQGDYYIPCLTVQVIALYHWNFVKKYPFLNIFDKP